MAYQNSYRKHGNGSSGRCVSFKTNRKNQNNRQRLRDDKFRKFLNDDIEMNEKVNQYRKKGMHFNRMTIRRTILQDVPHRRIGRQSAKRFPWTTNSCGWFQVSLTHGTKYTRKVLIDAIQQYVRPLPFVIYNIRVSGDDMSFYIDNEELAQALYLVRFKIKMPDGWKLQMNVRPGMPFAQMDESLKEKVKVVISSMFDATTQHLDLSKFYANEELLKNDLFVPLSRQGMLLGVFEIIAESIPNLRSLNLSNNKIFSNDHFVMLKRHSPNLKLLNLSNNKIKTLSSLTCLQGMKLETLVLEGNPLSTEFKNQTTYVREVRRIFKSLRELDSVTLPPPIDFGIEERQGNMPQSQDTFLCSPEGGAFAKLFIEQFYDMYDSQSNRNCLIDAYGEHAQFSVTAYSGNRAGSLNRYFSESRNWKRVEFDKRSKLLHCGRTDIVQYLNTLPKTQHDLPSFNVDVLVYKPEVISLCICGVFRETEKTDNINNKSNIKAFSRTFVLVHTGLGYNIINDMLSITNATPTQISKAFQGLVVAPPPIEAAPEIAPPVTMNVVQEELDRKRMMVTELALKTNMNIMWAEKCLMDTDWNFNNALHAFTKFHNSGQIPPEAFAK